MNSFPDHLDPTEAEIITKLIDTILSVGYFIDVRDAYGINEPVEPTNNRTLIEAEVAATGETVFDIYDTDGARGFILLVHGNGEDVISDSTDNETINELLK